MCDDKERERVGESEGEAQERSQRSLRAEKEVNNDSIRLPVNKKRRKQFVLAVLVTWQCPDPKQSSAN